METITTPDEGTILCNAEKSGFIRALVSESTLLDGSPWVKHPTSHLCSLARQAIPAMLKLSDDEISAHIKHYSVEWLAHSVGATFLSRRRALAYQILQARPDVASLQAVGRLGPSQFTLERTMVEFLLVKCSTVKFIAHRDTSGYEDDARAQSHWGADGEPVEEYIIRAFS